jgi:sulfoxide reductase catalytic subunit YedY
MDTPENRHKLSLREHLIAAKGNAKNAKVDLANFAGGIPQEMAGFPRLRIGRKWFTTAQMLTVLVPVGFAVALLVIAAAQHLRTLPEIQSFIQEYPGTGSFAEPVEDGFPWWLRCQHFLNLFIMLFMIRSGLQIFVEHPRFYFNAGCKPGTEWLRLRGPVPTDRVWMAKDDTMSLPGWLGLPGIRHSAGLARWWHFSFVGFWLLNGIVFYVLLFSTDQWQRLVPQSWDVFPAALSTAIQYASLDFPPSSGWQQYNGLQMLSYFTTVFVAAPLSFVTGMLQGPAIAARFKTARGPLNRQVARSLHFAVLVYFVIFILSHVAMVFSTGLLENLNHITLGVHDSSYGGLLYFGIAMVLIVLAWRAATPFTLKNPRLVQHGGRLLVGWLRALLEDFKPRANFEEKDISPYHWINGHEPESSDYDKHLKDGFKNYKVRIGGLVENPIDISFPEITALPKTEQITETYCIQGWSGIAKWGGVRMTELMKIARPLPEARFVVFYSAGLGPVEHEGEAPGVYYDCHKFSHMSHENTILAYEMNGEPLPKHNGAPLRLRNELELAFKQVKWIQAIEFVSSFKDIGAGEGGYNEDNEYFGYRGSI